MESILWCLFLSEDYIRPQNSSLLQYKFLASIARQDSEREGGSIVGGVNVSDCKL